MQPNQISNQPTPTPTPNPAPTSKNTKLPWTCATIAIILALAGIGFGVYSFMDSNNKSGTISTLETKVKTLNETIDKLQETTTETPTEPTENQSTTTDTEDYIYIGEWGIKIKIPSNLGAVSYSYNPRSYGKGTGADYGSLCIYGVKDLGDKELPSFWQNSGACVAAGPGREDDEEFWLGKKSTSHLSIGNTYFWAQGPQALYTTNPDEEQWEVSSSNLVLETLKNPENYSKF